MDILDTLPGEPQSVLVRLLVATGIGLLIGLEREYAKRVVDKEEHFAGVRTYPFIALLGFLSAYLAEQYGPWVFVAGLFGFIVIVIATYVMTAKSGSYGITTELSGVITFLLGAIVYGDRILFAIIITVLVTALLSLKVKLHTFITSLTPQDIRAFIQFTIISSLVLPFLPDETFGPNNVWDLHDIWLMVILVTGISLAGYVLSKLLGAQRGTLLTALIGGLVSSTAVTLNLAKYSKSHPSSHLIAAVGIIAATVVLYPRILFETWVVNPTMGSQLAPPIAFITAVAIALAFLIHRRAGKGMVEDMPLRNPLNFQVAIQFALIYMAVQWLIDLAAEHYSAQGLYATSLVFGATDMDAITLSVARTVPLTETSQGCTAILLASLSNTVMKFLIVVFFGDKALRTWVGIGSAGIFLATLVAMAFIQ